MTQDQKPIPFLPFIVESTPIEKVYSTLVDKSRNVNFIDTLKVFYAIANNGIDKVRKEYKKHEFLFQGVAYQEVITTFVQSQTVRTMITYQKLEVLQFIIRLNTVQNGNRIPLIEEMSLQEIAGFYMVMMLAHRIDSYSKLPFEDLIEKDLWAKSLIKIPDNIQFDDSSEHVVKFSTVEQLEGFIVYWGALSDKPLEHKVRAVLVQENSQSYFAELAEKQTDKYADFTAKNDPDDKL